MQTKLMMWVLPTIATILGNFTPKLVQLSLQKKKFATWKLKI